MCTFKELNETERAFNTRGEVEGGQPDVLFNLHLLLRVRYQGRRRVCREVGVDAVCVAFHEREESPVDLSRCRGAG